MGPVEKLVPFVVCLTGANDEQRLTVLARSRERALDEFLMAQGFANFHRKQRGGCRIDIEPLRKPGFFLTGS